MSPQNEIFSGDEVFIEVHPNNDSDYYLLLQKESEIFDYLLINGSCSPANISVFQDFNVIYFHKPTKHCYLKINFLNVHYKRLFTVQSFVNTKNSHCKALKQSLQGVPVEISLQLSRDVTNILANDNFSVSIKLENLSSKENDLLFFFSPDNMFNQ